MSSDKALPTDLLRESLDRQFAEYLRRACSILAPIYLGIIMLGVVLGESPLSPPSVSRWFSVAICGGLWLLLRRRHGVGWSHALGTFLVASFIVNYFLLERFTGNGHFEFQIALTILAIGAVYLSKRWFVFAEALALGASLLHYYVSDGNFSRAFDGPTPFGVLALALILFAVRLSLHRNYETLQWRRGHQKEELERAVEAAQREMREREQAQAALQASEEKYRVFIEGTDDIVTQVDSDGRITFANHTARKVYGLEPADCVGRPFQEFVHPADRAAAAAVLQGWVSAKVRSATLENRIVSTSGEGRTMLWSVNLIYDGDGGLASINSIGRDITQLRQAEEALRASEAQYRGIFEASTDGFIIHDMNGRIVEANPAVCRMHGYTREEFLGLSPEEMVHPDSLDHFAEHLKTTGQGKPFHCFAKDLRKDGTPFPVEIHGTRLIYHGTPHILGIVRDITDRIDAEEQRRLLEEQMQQAQKLESLGLLAGGIAHDFNNLLTGIMGNASLASSEVPADAPVQKTIEQIEVAAQRAAELCRQMLAYSGRGRFVVEPINVSHVAAELSALLKSSVSKKATVVCDLAEAIPAVEADATQLRQVIMNLMINASEALADKEGRITLRTGVRHCDETYLDDSVFGGELTPGRYVFLEVADTGCGMDPQTAEHIFDPFFTTKFTGRGLGLAAVLGIVRGHGGSLHVETQQNEGTAFTICLPIAAGAPAEAPPASDGGESWEGCGTILVVDDEQAVLDVAQKSLERSGFSVLIARDGQEAVDVFREHGASIDLVVLDLTMPRMSGEEVLAIIQQDQPELPVLLSSGFTEQDVVSRFGERRLAGFLHKPYRAHELVETVRRVLGLEMFNPSTPLQRESK